MIRSFACDMQTLARLARIEHTEIERAHDMGELMSIEYARGYALYAEIARIESSEKLEDFKNDVFHMCIKIAATLPTVRALTDAKRAAINDALETLIEAIK